MSVDENDVIPTVDQENPHPSFDKSAVRSEHSSSTEEATPTHSEGEGCCANARKLPDLFSKPMTCWADDDWDVSELGPLAPPVSKLEPEATKVTAGAGANARLAQAVRENEKKRPAQAKKGPGAGYLFPGQPIYRPVVPSVTPHFQHGPVTVGRPVVMVPTLTPPVVVVSTNPTNAVAPKPGLGPTIFVGPATATPVTAHPIGGQAPLAPALSHQLLAALRRVDRTHVWAVRSNLIEAMAEAEAEMVPADDF
eukprot:NODE_2193_length_1265_cov_47.273849_g1995_i0.p1 GENE.NODE_2193_length_1265_cov_47.273849_g1995_i0~~NODE_2193_length_1265_cov_47.273849_g1995_i0.p1  ORF type:complete len:252 (-),score=23.56 NODE_2193_length_1265_cov_47.273849_g1995_i0:421-1176(-)